MNNPGNNPLIHHAPATLEDIRQLKQQALTELQQQKKVVAKSAHQLLAPLTPAVKKGNALTRAFNTGMMAFDGVVMGIKLIRKLKKAFK